MEAVRTNERNVLKKQKAKRLYVNFCNNAKETAKKVGVTEKTMGSWIKDYGWRAERDIMISEQLNAFSHSTASIIDNDFVQYVKKESPVLAKLLNEAVNKFLRDLPTKQTV